MKKVTIPYFPTGMRYATPLIFGIAIYTWTIGSLNWAGVLTLLGIIILTTRYVTVIDLIKKSIATSYLFFGYPFKKKEQSSRRKNKVQKARKDSNKKRQPFSNAKFQIT